MAWATEVVSGRIGGGNFEIRSETLTTYEDLHPVWSSVIDFIPPGTDFTVIANNAATNLSASTHVELFTGYTVDADADERYRIDETPFIAVTSEVDSAKKVLLRNVANKTEYPFYWLKIPAGGGSVELKIIQGNNA